MAKIQIIQIILTENKKVQYLSLFFMKTHKQILNKLYIFFCHFVTMPKVNSKNEIYYKNVIV